jgi:catechol 2,3-dioxygenase-like lactoylglutathione lyase family enzyme
VSEAGEGFGLRRLAGATVEVPDPGATAEFLRDALRFEIRDEAEGPVAVCDGDYGGVHQAAIRLREGPALELDELIFEATGGLEELPTRLEAAGIEPRDGAGVSAAGVAFTDPSGIRIRVREPEPVERPEPEPLRPRRLGHVNLKATDPGAAAAFWQETMGMRLSEQIGEGLYFLRINSEHHNLGIRPGERGTLHHMGFEVEGWHSYEPILDRISALGHRVEYGPGRHTPGNNIFTYLLEPSSGLRIELFADMAQIVDAVDHAPARWEAGDRMKQTLNRWGPLPPESFLA